MLFVVSEQSRIVHRIDPPSFPPDFSPNCSPNFCSNLFSNCHPIFYPRIPPRISTQISLRISARISLRISARIPPRIHPNSGPEFWAVFRIRQHGSRICSRILAGFSRMITFSTCAKILGKSYPKSSGAGFCSQMQTSGEPQASQGTRRREPGGP